MVEFAAKPMDEPVLLKTFALSLNVFRVRELPNDDLHGFGQFNFEAIGRQWAGCLVRHSIAFDLIESLAAPLESQ
jgi:hypothetical protein